MMNLMLVTFDLDYTQFLVNADKYNLDCSWGFVEDEAIRLAIEAHIEWANDQLGGFDDDEVSLEEATNKENYSVENVDMEMLLEIIRRKDWYPCLYGGAVVFSN